MISPWVLLPCATVLAGCLLLTARALATLGRQLGRTGAAAAAAAAQLEQLGADVGRQAAGHRPPGEWSRLIAHQPCAGQELLEAEQLERLWSGPGYTDRCALYPDRDCPGWVAGGTCQRLGRKIHADDV